MKKTIKTYFSWKYVEVFTIVKLTPQGEILKTKRKGFASQDRPKEPDEVYASLSTTQTDPRKVGPEITLEPFLT